MSDDTKIVQINETIQNNLIFIILLLKRFLIAKNKIANLKSKIDLKNIKLPIKPIFRKVLIIDIKKKIIIK